MLFYESRLRVKFLFIGFKLVNLVWYLPSFRSKSGLLVKKLKGRSSWDWPFFYFQKIRKGVRMINTRIPRRIIKRSSRINFPKSGILAESTSIFLSKGDISFGLSSYRPASLSIGFAFSISDRRTWSLTPPMAWE